MPSPIDINNTFGALYIGTIVGAILFGLSCVQVFVYFQAHRDSGLTFYKFMVCWLWFLDGLHVFAANRSMYYYLITNYANPIALAEMVWSLKALIILDELTVYSVHLLYLQRIWIVNRGRPRILPVFMTVIIVTASAVSVALSWAIFKCQYFRDLTGIQLLVYMGLGTATLIDCLIAASLCYVLHTSKTGFAKTDMTLRTIMRDVINTGCLTSICSMACIITKALIPEGFISFGVEFLLSKLYVNSYLALLNARYYLGSDGGTTVSQPRPPLVYRPELQITASHDRFSPRPFNSKADEFKASDNDDYAQEHPDYHHIMGGGVRPIEVVVEMESFSK